TPARLPGRVGEGPGPRLRPDRRDGEALFRRALPSCRELGAADPRRLRLHGRVRDFALLPRPEDPRDRRGHERSAADGDCPPPGASVVIFRQFVDDDLGCGSYLVGDAGEAVVVDPAFAIEQYLEAAEQEGVRIVRVLE